MKKEMPVPTGDMGTKKSEMALMKTAAGKMDAPTTGLKGDLTRAVGYLNKGKPKVHKMADTDGDGY